MIDWNNPLSNITKNFTVHEATWLPQWKCHHIPSEEEKQNLVKIFTKLQLIRNFLDKPINVHCAIRPILNNPNSIYHGKDYNLLVGGSAHSAHKVGSAVDWDAGIDCDYVRSLLINKLEELDIRMEDNKGNWIHNDTFDPKPHRFFLP